MNEDLAFCEPDRSTLWQRFVRWLLPVKLCHIPSRDDIVFPTEDVIHVDTFTTFSVWERLKILAFGTVATSIRIVTEHKPGRMETIVATYVSTESREKSF